MCIVARREFSGSAADRVENNGGDEERQEISAGCLPGCEAMTNGGSTKSFARETFSATGHERRWAKVGTLRYAFSIDPAGMVLQSQEEEGRSVGGFEKERELARTASNEELDGLLYHPAAEVILALLDNPAFDENKLCLLLTRKDLPAEVLEEVAGRKSLLKNYAVKKSLLFHPRAPRLAGVHMLRDLYLMDLVQFALSPGVSAELKRRAEEHILARLPQLPLGQKITLGRRGPARVAGALLGEGHPQIVAVALDNPYLTEAQILKALARENVPVLVVQSLARHGKWSQIYTVRLAIVRNPSAPLATVLAFLPQLTAPDLRELAEPGIVSENLRKYLLAEVQRRLHAAEHKPAGKI
jgi:hypothetical protein